MWAGLLLCLLDTAIAFLTLDLLFRFLSVEPNGLRRRLFRAGAFYAALALLLSVAGGWVGGRLLSPTGWLLLPLCLVPWWLLWRFGLRKQFTFLFEQQGANGKEPIS